MKVKDKDKTKEQLIEELASLRQRTAEPEASETERKRMEDELTRHRQHLEALVEERTAELEASNEQLQHELAERKQAEELLRDSEDRFRSLVETTSDWIWEVDQNGIYTYVSPGINDLLGYQAEEVIGKTPFDLMPPDEAARAAEVFGPAVAERKPLVGLVNTNLHKDGRRITLETSGIPVFHRASGDFVGYRGIDRDITERKRAEEALGAQRDLATALTVAGSPEELFTVCLETAITASGLDSGGIYVVDGSSGAVELRFDKGLGPEFVRAASRFEPGSTQTSLVMRGKPVYSRHEEMGLALDDPLIREGLRALAVIPFLDGSKVIGCLNVSSHTLDDVSLVARGVLEAIAARIGGAVAGIQTAQALRESEEKYRSLVERANDGIAIIQDGIVKFVNHKCAEMLGYEVGELTGIGFTGLVPPEALEELTDRYEKRLAGEDVPPIYDARLLKKDGTTLDVEINAGVIQYEGKAADLVFYRDITERKQADEALRQSEERYRLLVENANEAIIVAQDEGLKFANPQASQLIGYSREELTSRLFLEFIHPDDRQMVAERHLKRLAGEELPGVYPFRIIRNEGDIRWAEINPVRIDWEGRPATLNFLTDITERRLAEEALKRSEENLRTYLENAPDAIFLSDLDGTFLYGNKKAEEIMGYKREELIGKSFLKLNLLPEEYLGKAGEALALSITGEPARPEEFELVRKDGSRVWVDINSVPLKQAEGTVLLGFVRDITEWKKAEQERKELEQKAHMASRLASVGLLASGVGHEINNPLTGVIGYAQLLLGRDVPEDIKKDLRAINDEAQRVANIVRKLVAFARYQKPQRAYAGISDIVAATVDLLAHQLKTGNIKVTTQLEPNLPWTIADIGQLQQVFLNLIINAETEMRLAHGKGKLSIKTEKTDNTIRISFQDNGPGIAEDNLEKIFDPFFTTREVGEGTGLGLSICHEIITEHGGTIHVQSEAGKGATFIVQLPIVTEQVEPELAEPSVEEPAKVARARVLVVDDQQVILDFVSRVLTDEGHEVETVDNAEDALKKIKSERYGLILLDIKMPGMRGDELYKRIQRIAESLARRVVFITGDVMGAETIDFLDRTEAPYVAKPFDAEELKKAINRILAEGA